MATKDIFEVALEKKTEILTQKLGIDFLGMLEIDNFVNNLSISEEDKLTLMEIFSYKSLSGSIRGKKEAKLAITKELQEFVAKQMRIINSH